MSDTNLVLSYLDDKLDDHRERQVEFILKGGQIKEFAEYQRLCGVIQGLDYAKQIIADLAKRELDSDDPD